MNTLIKSNFQTQKDVQPDKPEENVTKEYEKKAIESIGGSMVFVERNKLLWDK